MAEYPTYEEDVKKLPRKMFSGKQYDKKGFIFCYNLPEKRINGTWSNVDGMTKWYFIDKNTLEITENVYDNGILIQMIMFMNCIQMTLVSKKKNLQK
jgi:hypothetical protein